MFKRSMKGIVVLAAIMLVIFFAATPALAADVRNEDSIVIGSGDVINDDLYLAGSRIIINGTVNGDVMAAGDTITVSGKIDGSITAVGGTVNINGEVTRAVRAAAGNINVTGIVGRDLAIAGGSVDISSSAEIGNDLLFAAGNIRINAPVGGDVQGGGGEVHIANVVEGDVMLGMEPVNLYSVVHLRSESEFTVDRLTIEPTAHIKGNLTYISEQEANIRSGAIIEGQITHKLPQVIGPTFPALGVWAKVIAFLMTLVVGIVIVLVAPRRTLAIATSIKRKPLLSLGWGAIILIGTPIAALITFITIIGIPVGLLGMVLYGIALFLCQIAVGLFIGHWIISTLSQSQMESRGMLIAALTLGFVILTLVKLIPYVGWVIWLVTVLFGLGAMALSQKTMKEGTTAEVLEY